MAQGRVQAPQLNGPEPLQVSPLPGDTYVRPEQPDTSNQMAGLVDGLSHFNTALQRYGTVGLAAQRKQQQDDELAKANKLIAGHTNEQWLKAVADKQIPGFVTPMANLALGKFTGSNTMEALYAGLQNDIKTGKIDLLHPDTDIQKLLTERAKPYLENAQAPWGGVPGASWEKGYATGFAGRMETYRDALLKQQTSLKQGVFEKNRDGYTEAAFDQAITTSQTPEQAQERVRSSYPQFREAFPWNSEKGPPNAQLDRLLMGRLKEFASSKDNVDKVDTILNTERTADDGTKLPALSSNPLYAKDVQNLNDTIRKTRMGKLDDEIKVTAGAAAQAALEKADGSFAHLTSETYTNPYVDGPDKIKTVSAEDRKKFAVDNFLTQSKSQAATQNESPQVRFEREWRVFEGNSIEHPEWKNTLESTARAATTTNDLTNPQERAKALAAARMYGAMTERNYSYVKHELKLDKNADDFYTVFGFATKEMGQPEDRALDLAASAIRSPQSEEDLAVRAVRRREIEAKVKGNLNPEWYAILGGSADNQGALQKQVTDVAQVLTRVTGVTTDKAVDSAFDIVKKRTLLINGQAVPDTGYMPAQEMRPFVTQALDQVAKNYGSAIGVSKGNELSVRPIGGGNFEVIDRNLMLPVYAPKEDGTAGKVIISLNQLKQMQTDAGSKKQFEREDAQQKAVADGREKALDEMDSLASRQDVLDRGALGGEFRKAQTKRIEASRNKLLEQNPWLKDEWPRKGPKPSKDFTNYGLSQALP